MNLDAGEYIPVMVPLTKNNFQTLNIIRNFIERMKK